MSARALLKMWLEDNRRRARTQATTARKAYTMPGSPLMHAALALAAAHEAAADAYHDALTKLEAGEIEGFR